MTKHLPQSLRAAVAAAIVLACTGSPARAGYSEGGAFHDPGYGARAWGMGGAAVATVDDESAVYWNPAMLARIGRPSAGASYINLVPGATARESQVVYARALGRLAPDDEGVAIARHAAGAMFTNLHLDLSSGGGYDENILRVAYAFTPDEFITFGAAADLLFSSSDVDGFRAVGSSVDGAARVAITRDLTLGVVVHNAFSRYSYSNGDDYQRDRAATVGAAWRARRRGGGSWGTIEGDVIYNHGGLARGVIGAETRYWLDLLSLRAGFARIETGQSRSVPYLGFGLRALRNRLTLHYNANFDREQAFQDTHRFSLSVTL